MRPCTRRASRTSATGKRHTNLNTWPATRPIQIHRLNGSTRQDRGPTTIRVHSSSLPAPLCAVLCGHCGLRPYVYNVCMWALVFDTQICMCVCAGGSAATRSSAPHRTPHTQPSPCVQTHARAHTHCQLVVPNVYVYMCRRLCSDKIFYTRTHSSLVPLHKNLVKKHGVCVCVCVCARAHARPRAPLLTLCTPPCTCICVCLVPIHKNLGQEAPCVTRSVCVLLYLCVQERVR